MEYTNVATPEALKEGQPTVLPSYQVVTTAQGVSILLPLEALQKAFQDHMTALITSKSQYDNPVKKTIDNMFSSYNATDANKELKAHFDALIASQMKTYMATPSFQLQLGQAMAEEMARRAVDKLMPSK